MDFMLLENVFLLYIFIPGSFHMCQYDIRMLTRSMAVWMKTVHQHGCTCETWMVSSALCASLRYDLHPSDKLLDRELARPDPMHKHNWKNWAPPVSHHEIILKWHKIWKLNKVSCQKLRTVTHTHKKKQETPNRSFSTPAQPIAQPIAFWRTLYLEAISNFWFQL